MKKVINYVCFTIIFSFIFIMNTNAECSYQERKDLLNQAKSVDVSFEVVEKEEEYTLINPNTGEEGQYSKTLYSFKLNVAGITEDIFAKIYSTNDTNQYIVNYEDMTDGIYSIDIENTTDIVKYYVDFYSTNSNCYAEKITTNTITKPKENHLYYFSICLDERVQNSKYCEHFIEKDFSKSVDEIVSELTEIVNEDGSNTKNEDNVLNIVRNFMNSYWYILIIIIVIVVVFVTIILVRKKKNRL